MKIRDDRTEEQKATHTLAVGGTDRFLSGWGGAEGGSSFAFWACTSDDVDRCERAVRRRKDMKRVRVIIIDDYRPGPSCKDCHVYVWGGQDWN